MRLRGVMDVINQTVGDAISDLLLVETVLHSRGWSIADWSAAYTDLPNRQLKVSVKVGSSRIHDVAHYCMQRKIPPQTRCTQFNEVCTSVSPGPLTQSQR